MSTCKSPSVWLKVKHQQTICDPWKEPSGAIPLDDSLTNLQWLQEFSFHTAEPQNAAGPHRLLQVSDAPASPPAGDTAATGMPPSMGKPISSSSLQPLNPAPDAADYRTNAQLKPPYSYATLICMAMQASKEAKLSLSAIYTWITENFCYYRHAEPSWQNSIRHNLSLNKCFKKVPRRKDEPGKGGFWQIDPQYSDMFVNGVFQRRRMPALPVPATKPEPGPSRGAGHRCPQERTVGMLRGHRYPLGKHKQPPATSMGKAALPGPPSPRAPAGGDAAALPEDLAWTTALEDPFAGSLDVLELNTALSSLAAGEDLTPQTSDHHLGDLSQGSPTSSVTALGEDLTLCPELLPQPWEEATTEPTLVGPAWDFEEGACFSEGFLTEIQPWEV